MHFGYELIFIYFFLFLNLLKKPSYVFFKVKFIYSLLFYLLKFYFDIMCNKAMFGKWDKGGLD